jgi:signal transduction histidine kinase/CHASE3 domain sensor protein
MESSDSSRLQRMRAAIARFREPSEFKPFLTTIWRGTRDHAHWLALGLLVTVGLFSYWNTSTLIKTNSSQIQLRMLLTELQEIRSTMVDAETGQRGYLLVGEESYLEPYQTAAKLADRHIDWVEKLMNLTPGQRSKFDALQRLIAEKFTELNKTIELRRNKGIEAALQVVRTDQGKNLMDQIRGLVDEINQETQERLAKYDGQIVAVSMGATVWSILGNVLAAIVLVLVFQREFRERARVEARAQELARAAEKLRIETFRQTDGKIEALGQQAGELARSVETLRIQATAKSEGEIGSLGQPPRDLADEIEALGQQARELARSVENSRIETLNQSDEKIEALGKQARDLACAVEKSRIQTLNKSDKKIEALGKQARELARSVESSRLWTLNQSDKEIEALGQRARELATSVESSRLWTLNQSDKEIEALGKQARDLATLVESSRLWTLNQSDKEIEALGQQARDLATLVESSRIETLNQSDKEIEALGQQARELATLVESSRVRTLNQSDKEIEALGQRARELATLVESSRIETLNQSDKEIEALGQQARELATVVESSRIETLNQSDKEIEALGQQARELATVVESSRIETLNRSNQEIRKLNEELEQRVLDRTAQLEAANKELDSFSYSVSHDLRAPLRAIDGFSRIVIDDYSAPLAPEGKAYLQKVRDNTRQMGMLVDDLLAFARLGRQALTKHTVDTDKIVRRCLEEMAKEVQGRKVEIVIGDLPACRADSILLKQVWTNLLSNALKYTRKQELARIEIGCRTEPRLAADGQPSAPGGADSELVYFVKDNGAGFDMKYIGKLFGVFQRLHRAADYEGTGVGLAIVQRIVQRHGGRIWADAKPNQGATFYFTLA